MFCDAWTIVRSCHTIYETIRKENVTQIDIPHADVELGRVITKARNKMDHIAGNIGNYAKLTADAMPPLLGILTACFIPKWEKGATVDILQAVALTHSDYHHAINFNAFPSAEELFPFTGWMAHVRLHAFDCVVELSKAADFVGRLLQALNSTYSRPEQQRLNGVISMRGQAPFVVTYS